MWYSYVVKSQRYRFLTRSFVFFRWFCCRTNCALVISKLHDPPRLCSCSKSKRHRSTGFPKTLNTCRQGSAAVVKVRDIDVSYFYYSCRALTARVQSLRETSGSMSLTFTTAAEPWRVVQFRNYQGTICTTAKSSEENKRSSQKSIPLWLYYIWIPHKNLSYKYNITIQRMFGRT